MRVVEVTDFGGPEVLVPKDAEDPVADAGELVVDVEVVEVIFLDTQMRRGWARDFFPLRPPFVPGTGVAGTVGSVGAGVDRGWVGRRVVARTGDSGAYVERFAARLEDVFEVPDMVDLELAIAALHDGPTALSRLERADVRAGERVLVTAAAGSLGGWFLPLTKAAGAHVIAAARGKDKLVLASEHGADVLVDYSQPNWVTQVREATGGDGVDVVFDGVGGEVGRGAFEVTSPGGRFFAYGSASGSFADFRPDEAEQRQVSVVGIDDRVGPADLRRLTNRALALIADGSIRPVIGQTFPFEEAAAAHSLIEDRKAVGKTLLLHPRG
jgi:NADPH:quinone reductase